MELRIRTIEEIKDIIYRENAKIMDFPVISDFIFPELYKEIVILNNTIDISTNCSLFNIIEALEITDFYKKNNKLLNIYWIIGNNIFDYWVMDKNGKIYYWGKNEKDVIDVNINFEQWLQFAYLDNDNDENTDSYESLYEGDYDQKKFTEYINKLKEISKELSEFMFNALY